MLFDVLNYSVDKNNLSTVQLYTYTTTISFNILVLCTPEQKTTTLKYYIAMSSGDVRVYCNCASCL